MVEFTYCLDHQMLNLEGFCVGLVAVTTGRPEYGGKIPNCLWLSKGLGSPAVGMELLKVVLFGFLSIVVSGHLEWYGFSLLVVFGF